MKKLPETERKLVSAFYIGKHDNYDDCLVPKLGQTKRPLEQREKEIRDTMKMDFHMLGCVMMFCCTEANRKQVESEVRSKMEKYGKNWKKDHFLVPAKAKKYRDGQYVAFALVALAYAVDVCRREGFPYKVEIFSKNFQKKG